MSSFLKNELKMLLTFFRESKLLMVVILFFMLLSYGIKVFYYSFSIDTEMIFNNYAVQMDAWETIGRIGLVFTKFLLFQDMFNPYVANFLTYLTFTITCILLCYLVQRILNNHVKRMALMVIPILFLTHPIFAEQFNFILQSFEVSLAILFIVIALFLCFYYIHTGFKIFAIIAIFLCSWSLLTYQSLILFFIAGAIASFILILYQHEQEKDVKEFKVYVGMVFKYLCIFLAAMILSQLLVMIHTKLTGLGSSYLTRQILWGKSPALEVIKNILAAIKSIVFAEGIFYNYGFLISALIILLIQIGKMLQRHKMALIETLSFLLLFLSPFLLTIFIGQSEAFRAQMPAIQFVIGFNFYYIYLHLKNKLLQRILVILCIIIAFNQSNVTANLLYSDFVKFQEDVTMTNRINFQLDGLGVGDRRDYSLVFLGYHEPQSIPNIKGETLGHSFFAWDKGTKAGTSYRAIAFMRTQGYWFNQPTEEQLDFAQSIEKKLAVWPEKNSIEIVDHLIIIKLSE